MPPYIDVVANLFSAQVMRKTGEAANGKGQSSAAKPAGARGKSRGKSLGKSLGSTVRSTN